MQEVNRGPAVLRVGWTDMRRCLFGLVVASLLGASYPAEAQPDLEDVLIGVPDPIRIAIPIPVVEGSVTGGEEHAKTAQKVLDYDLSLSRNIAKPNFEILPNRLSVNALDAKDRQAGRVDFTGWQGMNAQYVLKLTLRSPRPDRLQMDVLLYDVLGKRSVLAKRTGEFASQDLRRYAHSISDDIVERTTPYRGIASTQIAFVNESHQVKEIFLMDYDGDKSSVRQLTDFGSTTLFPAWSPDHETLTYTSYRNNWCDAFVHRVNAAGPRAVQVLCEYVGNNLGPRFNPNDGRELAISLSHKGNPDINLVNESGDILRRLTNHPRIDTAPAFSPNGQEIVWTSDRTGYPQLYIMDRDGANVRRLTNFRGLRCDTAVWSPVRIGDDYRIAFYGHQGGNVGDVFTVRPDGTGLQQLSESGADSANPTWSPDGMYIAYSSNKRGASQIYLMQYNGQPPPGHKSHMRLTYMPGNNLSPSWSP